MIYTIKVRHICTAYFDRVETVQSPDTELTDVEIEDLLYAKLDKFDAWGAIPDDIDYDRYEIELAKQTPEAGEPGYFSNDPNQTNLFEVAS